ncbi:MAG: fumarylacetoacetate hydrolase family protein [Spirochaetales bacterium]|nr:fumarylacetoacetate hydrolase family protein [Spirochaetales bacterium]
MKFICIGKNYLAHAQEMGGLKPSDPMFFFKPDNANPVTQGVFPYPDFSTDIHHEVELAILIDRGGRNISQAEASSCYSKVTLGIDFTARDLQRRQIELGFPWEICKAFEDSAPVGSWVNVHTLGKGVQELAIELRINDETRQVGYTKDMIFPVDQLIAYVSRFVSIDPGDIILTGTPEGVGPVLPGDILEAYLEGDKVLEVVVTAQQGD